MTYLPRSQRNPFDNPFLALVLHSVTALALVSTGYLALSGQGYTPLLVAVATVVALEVLWLYYRLRRP